MSITVTRILSTLEFITMNNAAMAKGYYHTDPRIFTPGMAWEEDWIYDPFGVGKAAGRHIMIKSPTAPNKDYLSIHYWKDWAHIRPPITVICPNGKHWGWDRKSSNGDGWVVTMTESIISCHPSIDVPGYHGWFTNGTFSHDLNGRGPIGIAKPLPEGLLPCK